ncbi:MAG: cell wall-binding repeat-containing protein, partial [Catenulispora sp.]|nr:cell wall-binding repeat-containing protein [Catenulispora sp.]
DVITVDDAGDPLTIPVSGTAADGSTGPTGPTDPGGTTGPTGPSAPAVSRLSGGDRYATGVAVSQAQWAAAGGDATSRARAQEVVLARGDQFPDALAGVPLAAAVKGPLLLTDPKTLTPDTEKEIQRVLPRGGTVNVLGLSGAVSDAVAGRLTQLGYHVVRHGGEDRYATARAIATKLHSAKVILATGQDYADALSAGPFATGPAATGGVPAAILLTDGKTLDPVTAGFVKSIAAGSTAAAPTVFAVGGQAATAASHLGGYVKSFSGADRYATDAMVVGAIAAASPLTHLGIATGLGFPDALTGGAFTASQGGALVIIPSTLGPDTTHLLNALAPRLATVTMFGGKNVVSETVAGQITTAVGGRPQ